MPPVSQVHLDRALTDFAIAFLAEPSDFVVGQVFPIVPVDHISDKYFILDRNPFARGDAKPRLPNTESSGFDYTISNSNYNCQLYAEHVDVDRRLIENADEPRLVEEGATRLVIDNIRITHEVSWANAFFQPSTWGNTDIVGGSTSPIPAPLWDDYGNSDPKAQIKYGRRVVMTQGGREPNVLVSGYDVFLALEDHPLIVDRVKHVSDEAVSAAIIANYLGVEKYIVLRSTKATSNPGQAATFDFVHGRNALLCYAAPSPGMMIPSAGYTFSWKGTSGGGVMNEDGTAAVNVIDKPLHKSLRYECEMNWADQITAPFLGQFYSNIVSTNI